MKKKLYSLIFSLLLLSVVKAQQVANPGFETGSFSPWTSWTPGGSWADIVDHNARSGNYCIQLTGNECSVEQKISNLKPNTPYILEGWAKLQDLGQSVRLGIDNPGGIGGGFAISSSTTYKKLTVKFTTSANPSGIKIYFYKPNLGSWAYGDDITIREANDNPPPGNTNLTFTPDEVSLIRNPGMGWTLYDDAADDVANASDYWAKQGGNAEKFASTFYLRWRWSEMEPEEGKYAWLYNDNFKALIKGAKDRNLKLAFRVYTDSQDNWHQATPKYVFDAGAKSYKTTDGRNNNTPFLDDPVFQKKFTKFIHAFAAEFDDPAVVDYIDGYNFGWWGEGHNERYFNDSWESKVQVWKWIFDLYGSSFKKVIPVVPSNIFFSTNYDIVRDFAIVKNNYVPRRDGLGSKYVEWWEAELQDRLFPAAMFVGEQCYWGGSDAASPNWKPWVDQNDWTYPEGATWATTYQRTYDDAIRFHANYLDLREVTETEGWIKDTPHLVQSFMVRGGYRLFPSKVSVPPTIILEEPFKIQHEWKNIGVGVCPNNNKHWNNKYKVAFAILEPGSGIVKKMILDENANPADWIDGSNNGFDLDVTLTDVPKGNYVLGVAIINAENNNKPEIKLAIKNGILLNSWTKIADITVQDATEKLNYYRSIGDVDLGSISNWEVYDSENWVSPASPPSGNATGILIRDGHRWSNNSGSLTTVPNGVTLTIQTSLFGIFDKTHRLFNNGTVVFNGINEQTVPEASGLENDSWGNVTIKNPAGVVAVLNADHSLQVKKLDLNSGVLTIQSEGNTSLLISDVISVDKGTVNLVGASGSISEVQLNGNTLQSLPKGVFKDNKVPSLTINNLAGVNLDGNVEITHQLVFSNGKLTLGDNSISVGEAVTGADASRFVVTNGTGKLRINNIGDQTIIFPIGHSESAYTPISLTNNGDIDDFTASVHTTLSGVNLFDPSKVIPVFWEISEDVPGGSSALLTVQWNQTDADKAANAKMDKGPHVMGHFVNDSWDKQIVKIEGTDPFTSSNLIPFTSFSPFAIAMDGAFDNTVLPVRLVSFTGHSENGVNYLNWSTAQEINFSHFEIERSQDGLKFAHIGEKVTASKVVSAQYRFTDENPLPGKNYYRLKSIDLDGTYNYSDILFLNKDLSKSLRIHPNPVGNSKLSVSHLPAGDKAFIEVMNLNGMVHSRYKVKAGVSATPIDLSNLPSGIYLVTFHNNEFSESIRVVR